MGTGANEADGSHSEFDTYFILPFFLFYFLLAVQENEIGSF